MKRKVLIGHVLAATILTASQARAAGLPPPDPTSLLIRYRVVGTDITTQVTSTFDGYIFRDGLIIERLTNDIGKCQTVRASALPERLSNLKTTLARNRVDHQQGNCISEPPGNFIVDRQVTWFGRGRRQHSYRYGFADGLGGSCPDEIRLIDHAISEVLGTAINVQIAQACP